MSQPSTPSVLGLQLIGAFKFACGVLLVVLGVGLFRGHNGNPGEEAAHLVSALKLDPDNQFIHAVIEKISGISPKQLRAIGVGTFLYALLYLVEGGGLLLKRHWAEYLTVVATGIFIPVEIYEVAQKPSAVRLAVLLINVAIVAYLIYQLMRKKEAGPIPAGPSSTPVA